MILLIGLHLPGDLSGVSDAGRLPSTVAVDVLQNPSPRGLKVRWQMPSTRSVRIEVFEVAGRNVGTVADGQMQPGIYQAQWPQGGGSSVSSGVYFVRMQAGADVRRARVVVLK